jgi:translation initiation factor 1A
MPNRTGGKNYKKSKQTGSMEKPFLEKQDDQQYGRVLRNLGGRNMLIYCNDNKIRLCHICGAMRKFNWLSVGDIVIISLREFEKKPEAGSKEYEKGDILAKYDVEHLGKLKKQPNVNQKLFMQLETMDGTILAAIGEKEEKMRKEGKLVEEEEDDGGIEFDRDGTEEDSPSNSDGESESTVGNTAAKPKVEKGNKPVKVNKAANATVHERQTEEDDINIDDI